MQAWIAPNGRETEVISGFIRFYEDVVILAVMGLYDQDASHAPEYGHVAVACIAVQRVAALSAVQHVAVQFSDFRSNGQPGVRVVRILDGYGEQIAFQRYRRSMLRTCVHPYRSIGVPLLFQLMLVDKHHLTGAVVEDRRPLATYVQVRGAVTAQVQGKLMYVLLDQVEVVSMRLHEYPAIEHVGRVGI